MTVRLRHHDRLELNRVDYSGRISLAELAALVEFQSREPTWLTYDALSVVLAGADFTAVEFDALDALFEQYKTVFRPLSFPILRRGAWLNFSPGAQAHVDYWVKDRNQRSDISSDVRRVTSFEEAGVWLVLRPDYIATLETGAGFREIARFHEPPAAAPSR